jgi:hypothetical protein
VGFALKKRLLTVFLTLCIAGLFVGVTAATVAGFATWYEVIYRVASACIVFYEVVCFCCWLSAPVARWVVCK